MQLIARVAKSNGADGGLLMEFRGVDSAEIDTEEPVFIEFDGLPVPFYFDSFVPKGPSKAVVRLTMVRSLADAEELVGRDVFVPDGTFEDEGDGILALSGWTVMDGKGTEVGKVTDTELIPGNPCIVVQTKSGSVLLPLNERLILGTDPSSKVLTLEIPEGLLDL